MENNEQINVNIELINPNGKLVRGIIAIRDKKAILMVNDGHFCKRLYEAEVKAGNKNVEYNKDNNAFIENYPYYNKDEIYKKLKKEIEKTGGNFTLQ